MSYSNINDVFNNNNLKKDNTIKWDDFSDDEYSTHKKYSLMDIGTLMDTSDMNTINPDAGDSNNGTTINSLINNEHKGRGQDRDSEYKGRDSEGNISHRDCIKKYFNISSHPLNLNIALKHIKSCSICQNEIERINSSKAITEDRGKEQELVNVGQDCKSCNYVPNKNNLINKIDELSNKVNTLTNGYGHVVPSIDYNQGRGYNQGHGQERDYITIDYMNYRINDAVKNSVNDAVKNSINDFLTIRINDIVRSSVNDAIRSSVNDVVRSSVNDVVRTNINKREHFTDGTSTSMVNSNNSNNLFITISIVLIIILLLIDIYLRVKKD